MPRPLPALALLSLLPACGTPEGGPGELLGDGEHWYRGFGGRYSDWAADVAWGPEGELYAAVDMAWPEPLTHGWLYRVAASGELQWEADWSEDGDAVLAALAVEGERVFAAGHWTDATGTRYATLRAYSREDGSLLWAESWGSPWAEALGLAVGDGAVYATGWGLGAEGSDAFARAYSPEGELLWSSVWDDPGWDELWGRPVLLDGTLWAVGRFGGEDASTGGEAEFFQWDAASGEPGARAALHAGAELSAAYDLALDASGERLYAVGVEQEGEEEQRGLAWGLSAEGRVDWELELEDVPVAVAPLPAGGALLAAGDGELLLAELSQDGERGEEERWAPASPGHLAALEGTFALAGAYRCGEPDGPDGLVLVGGLEPLALPPSP